MAASTSPCAPCHRPRAAPSRARVDRCPRCAASASCRWRTVSASSSRGVRLLEPTGQHEGVRVDVGPRPPAGLPQTPVGAGPVQRREHPDDPLVVGGGLRDVGTGEDRGHPHDLVGGPARLAAPRGAVGRRGVAPQRVDLGRRPLDQRHREQDPRALAEGPAAVGRRERPVPVPAQEPGTGQPAPCPQRDARRSAQQCGGRRSLELQPRLVQVVGHDRQPASQPRPIVTRWCCAPCRICSAARS